MVHSNKNRKKTKYPNMLPIGNLSDDSLFIIFSYLPVQDKLTVEKVCQRWRKISERGWPDVKTLWMDHHDNFTSEEISTIFKRCGRFVKKIRLLFTSNLSVYYPLIKKNCVRLQAFDVMLLSYNAVGECFKAVSKKPVEYISISGDSFCQETPPFSVHMSKLKFLQHLKLSDVTIPEKSLRHFNKLTSLKSLVLSGSQVHEGYIEDMCLFVNLEKLELDDVIGEINDSHVINIARNCKNLKALDLSGLKRLTDACFEQVSRLPHLEELSINNLTRITNNALRNIKNLKKVSCELCPNIQDDSLIPLVEFSPELRYLYGFGTITEKIVKKLNITIKKRVNGIKLEVRYGYDDNGWISLPVNTKKQSIVKSIGGCISI